MARNWSYITVCTWWNPCKLVLQTLFFLCCITTRMSYSSCTFKIYVGLRTNYKLVKEDNTPHSTCTCCMILPDSQLKGAYDIVSQNAGKILDNKISLWAQTNVSCSKTPKGTRTSPPPPPTVRTQFLELSCWFPPLPWPCPEMFLLLFSSNKQTEIITHFHDIWKRDICFIIAWVYRMPGTLLYSATFYHYHVLKLVFIEHTYPGIHTSKTSENTTYAACFRHNSLVLLHSATDVSYNLGRIIELHTCRNSYNTPYASLLNDSAVRPAFIAHFKASNLTYAALLHDYAVHPA